MKEGTERCSSESLLPCCGAGTLRELRLRWVGAGMAEPHAASLAGSPQPGWAMGSLYPLDPCINALDAAPCTKQSVLRCHPCVRSLSGTCYALIMVV